MTRPSLAGIEKRAAEATEGPWEAIEDDSIHAAPTYVDNDGCGVIAWRPVCDFVVRHGDAEFIADSRAAVPALAAAVRDVLDMHQQHEDTGKCAECTYAPYSAASVPWPCPTVRALAAHLDLTDPEGDPR